MKQFEKKYEDFYTSDRMRKHFDLEKLTVSDNTAPSDYINQLKGAIDNLQVAQFDYLVKIVWLMKKFVYNGSRRKNLRSNGIVVDGAFTLFMRQYVNHDNKILTSNPIMSSIVSYFDEIFPDFNDSNPFDVAYKFPFKFMNWECMLFVYRMPERMELLQYGEDNKMSYPEFIDYVLNYIFSYNAEFGETYEVSSDDASPGSRGRFFHVILVED